MSAKTTTAPVPVQRDRNAYPIDESQYRVEGQSLEFWKAQTGINDEAELKKHILKVQAEAYAVFAYGCIRHFMFLKPRITTLPVYDQFVKLGKERPSAILLDVGCCFGTDTRKIAADGWPMSNIVATDIHPQFWELGHKLFRSTKETFPVTFVPGNLLDPAHLEEAPVLYTPSNSESAVDVTTLTSLNPLRGHVSAIHAGGLFHLFTEEQQAHLARALAGLLAPAPGCTIVGSSPAAAQKGFREVLRGDSAGESSVSQFWHSPESWTALWDGEAFEKGTVEVVTKLAEPDRTLTQRSREGYTADVQLMTWSVTRL